MESLETATGSPESQESDAAPNKCPPEAAKISRSPSVEMEGNGWHQHLQEGLARETRGPKKAPDSGKSLTFEDSTSQTQDTEASSLSLQAAKAAGRLRKSPSSPEQQSCYSGMELHSDAGGKAEPKPQKPGKYVCDYCGRACAKPSVLKKHIRSHTGERPYPCVPCGFSFKTKSNLYKHRKSHAHSVKAGTSPFPHNVSVDQGSFEGEGELFSDAEQSTDTDEDAFSDPLLLLDSPAEASDHTAVKVLNLISHKKASAMSMSAQDSSSQPPEINAPPAAAAEANCAIQSCTIKQRLALRLSEKRSSDSEHNLSLPSQSSKGSTDSGYFSRSESAEHQTSPPNANAKSYQEIMFGKCYRPSPKQTTAYVACSAESGDVARCSEKAVSRVFTQEKDTVESIKINTKSFAKEEAKEAQFDSGSDTGTLLRSNSMPASSAVSLTMPQSLRGSHSFDERTSNAGMRRLRRQAAFELPTHEVHTDSDGHGKASEMSPAGLEMDNSPPSVVLQRHAMELATRKRRKEKREEEDLPHQYEVHHEQCEEMFDSGKDYEPKLVSHGAVGVVKGHLRTQLDRSDMDISASPEMRTRKTLGNVISVIQHTNFINRPRADQSDSYKSLRQRQEAFSSFQPMEESFEVDRGDGILRQSFQLGAKLVRQPNIQVPEIRVTVEPDSPEKAPDVPAKEPEKHVEEFQWPQRSETLAQFPPEKLPPKKKRLRLADIEHSSGESSFESACTSLSRSPSQDSNLSYSSAFSFDRDESLKPVSPARQDEFGKPLELLAVPGSGRSLSVLHQRQQHEMRRSSSEQAPCKLRKEFPEVRSVSFDYGSLSPTSKVRPGDLAKERRRGNLVRQESLSMDTEASHVQMFCGGATSSSLPIFSTGNTLPQPPHPGLLIPVRIQTHVPSYGSLTYTSVSQIFDNRYGRVSPALAASQNRPAEHTLSVEALDLSSAKLKTGIPLSLTSRTISTTNASSGGANKRMLSPASSLDLFVEVKQQKRVKEERMFGQIVAELSAVELGECHLEDDSHRSEFITLRKLTGDHSVESPMESSSLDTSSPPYPREAGTDKAAQMDTGARPLSGRDISVSEDEHRRTPSAFPSLRTATGVSWCYLSYTKPSCSHDCEGGGGAPFSSVYATWHVSSRNPNLPELSTSAALALLHSKQKAGKLIYSMAAMCQPGNGKLVSSLVLWRQTFEQLQRKPEPKEADVNPSKKAKDASFRLKAAKEEWKEREASNTQTAPTRIKIFEGGYKSNEDYVYVRGRGRGKYICEECGIRCKKPSMLKKHIRTHTDVRPYICKVCNFAFKTKGNLTKHMKSKAHMKKCLELGVSVTMDETEIQEHVDEAPQESKAEVAVAAKHQFSDAEYSDGMDEDADDVDEDEDEDDDYEGDSTPKLRSRSTSPQPGGGVTSLPVTVTVSGRWPGSDQRDKTTEDDSLSVLSPDQAGFLFDPYSSCLLSPGWESPIREPSPSRLRYPSPRRELSPRGRCSPRWDATPLRPGSPGFSPVQHLSPPVAQERPTSPGTEMAGKRESAVRGRQRVVLRAVSPRRGGSHQQRGGGDKSRQHAKIDMAQQQGAFEMELEQRSISGLPAAVGGAHQNLLSHLPLHSQQQAFSLLPVLPIGGALRAPPPSPAASDVPPSPPSEEGATHVAHEMAEEDQGSLDSGVRDGREEENVQTCLKAIASLKINTEDPH
ncbi:transcription factor HIVEP2 isoform X1 [Phyllopteryx taeniolatus]|uniref:transcription factor HIVEP2 isoform X1 n=1 Tax=Phyllopteryx taeniolatus TaxID=161469 RepID=UPI002AD42A4C|nr:transcription factor HIVEP2 isoform X1 [Phyllopteryx taeniolatus]XP_061652041.1 transcription factor HIVEP2 isoform X1 [Phyllopteryx taeniolatus]